MTHVDMRASRITIFALVALAGCQKSETPLTEETFCAEYARIECGKVAEFCSFNPATCEPARVIACKAEAVTRRGTTRTFAPGNTDACLKKLEEAFRSQLITGAMLTAVDQACARVYQGSAKALEPCQADNDCLGGLICDKGLCGTEKLVPAGSQCSNIGERCQPDEYCTVSSPNGPWRCLRRAAEDAMCSREVPCLPTLRCRTTCSKRLANGDECQADDDCLSNYCTRYVSRRTCGTGLSFSPESPSCFAYSPGDGGVPGKAPNTTADASPPTPDLAPATPDTAPTVDASPTD
jgi:hypothetical protein